jgi:uncharacterized protein (TIGR02391 family)
MARPQVLDKKLLEKVRQKLKKKDTKSVNVLVSKKASSLGVSSESALVLIAKGLGIGVSTYQRKLDQQKQSEIRDILPTIFYKSDSNNENSLKKAEQGKKVQPITNIKHSGFKESIEYILDDQQLKERCTDLLNARAHFDRPINQATLVLEDRIRSKAQPTERMEGIKLVNHAFNSDLSKTVLQVSINPDEQDGFTNILRGIVLAFRNPTHHHIINTFSKEEALKICGLVDVLLKVVDKSKKIKL